VATNKLVQRKKERFLTAFRELASISAAARSTKIARSEHYRWMREDEDYAAQFGESQEVAADALEDEAVRRAKEGTQRPVFQGGKLVGKIREYSDTLLIFLLKAARPKKYRDKFIVIPAGPADEKTPTGVVWVAGKDESSTDKPDPLTASGDSIN